MSAKKRISIIGNEDGMLLVTSMLVLVLLTIIGVSMTSDSVIELTIAGNDRLHKETFFQADGGTEWGHEVLEQNIACLTGFEVKRTYTDSNGDSAQARLIGDIYVKTLNMWLNTRPGVNDYTSSNVESDDYFDMFLPDNTADHGYYEDGTSNNLTGEPMTIVKVGGNASLATGAAIQMAAGYEGKGKAIGMGGAILAFSVNAKRIGKNNSEAAVCLGWRHTIGQEGECYY